MILVMILGATVAYPVIMRLLAVWVQPMRLEMARVAKGLLEAVDLDGEHKRIIEIAVTDAFDPKVAIIMVGVLPLYAIKCALNDPSTKFTPVPARFSREFDSFMSLYTRSIAAANPVFFFLLVIESMMIGAIAYPFALLAAGERSHPTRTKDLALAKSDAILYHWGYRHQGI